MTFKAGFSSLVLSAALATAAGSSELAVAEGAPPFELNDLDGTPRTLDQAVARGPLVLVFFRGAW